jgi:hypothetical protein
VIERQIGNITWYVTAVSYPTAIMSRRAWERAMRRLDMSKGDAGIGVTRLAPYPRGEIKTGAPAGQYIVIAVSMNEKTSRKAGRLLRDGKEFEPTPDFVSTLILRRIRMAKAQATPGRVTIQRPEGRGATIDQLGNLKEAPPGEG